MNRTLSDEKGQINLFGEGSENAHVCSVCGLPLEEGVLEGKDLGGKVAHLSCIEDNVLTGVVSVDDTRLLESINGIKSFSWVAKHPEVCDNGCVVCGEPIEDRFYVASKQPSVFLVHRECVAGLIATESLSGEEMSRLCCINSTLLEDMQEEGMLACPICKKADGNNTLVTKEGKMVHKECYKKEVENGNISKWALLDVCALNGILAYDFESIIKKEGLESTLNSLTKMSLEVLRKIWDKVKLWAKGLVETLKSVISSYDSLNDSLQDVLLETEGVTASLEVEALEEDVKKAMDFLLQLRNIELEREKKINELLAGEEVKSLSKVQEKNAQKIISYLQTLKNKQRAYRDGLFRLTQVKHREVFSSKKFREFLRNAFAANAEIMNKIKELEVQATSPSVTSTELEVLLQADLGATPEESDTQTSGGSEQGQ